MEVDRPTGADYPNANAQEAKQAAEGTWAEINRLHKRVGILEAQVKGLFLVLNHVIDGNELNRFIIDDETGEVSRHD